jgi:hypothetical protein
MLQREKTRAAEPGAGKAQGICSGDRFQRIFLKERRISMERKIQIHVGGKRVALNKFAKQVLTNAITGMLSALRDVDVDQEISVTISRR